MVWLVAAVAAIAVLVVGVYSIVFGQKSQIQTIRSIRKWVTGDGLKTMGYLVPLGYVVIFAYFLHMFDVKCAPKLGSVHHSICRLLYLLPFSAMGFCVFSDPGAITKETHYDAMRAFKYDRILYMPHVECRTCLCVKPARSKHCSVCDKCVELEDHHCIWINNCVGRNNWRYFFYFLVVHLFIFGYGLWLLVPMVTPGWAKGHNFKDKIWGMIRENETAMCLIVLCFLIGWITAIFSAYTLYFVYLGTTTNEQEKWDDVKDLIYDGTLYVYKLPQGIHKGSIVLQKYDDGSFNRKLTAYEEALVDQYRPELVRVLGFEDLNNIYDNGFVNNLKLLLFPY